VRELEGTRKTTLTLSETGRNKSRGLYSEKQKGWEKKASAHPGISSKIEKTGKLLLQVIIKRKRRNRRKVPLKINHEVKFQVSKRRV